MCFYTVMNFVSTNCRNVRRGDEIRELRSQKRLALAYAAIIRICAELVVCGKCSGCLCMNLITLAGCARFARLKNCCFA